MNIYKSPKSNLERNNEPTSQFGKFYFFGSIYAIIIVFVISAIAGLLAAKLFGYDISDIANLDAIYNDPLLLIIDITVTIACLYIAGYLAARYLVSNYILHGSILGFIVLLIVISVLIRVDGFENLPFWYNFLSIFIIIPSIAFGSFKRKI